MEWYYSAGDGRQGPVSDPQFQTLISQGIVTERTLVWRESMPDWAPLSTVTGPATLAGAPPLPTGCICAECGQTYALGDIVQVLGANVCLNCKDRALDKLRMGMSIGGAEWRDGVKLVVSQNSQLSDCCVKCSRPAEGARIKRKYYWHHPALYILAISPLIYIIVALIVRKSVRTELGVCPACQGRRRRDLWIGCLGVFASIGLIAVAVNLSANKSGLPPVLGFGGMFLVLASLIWISVRTPVLRVTRIKNGLAWLKGCHKDCLAKLPEWTGG